MIILVTSTRIVNLFLTVKISFDATENLMSYARTTSLATVDAPSHHHRTQGQKLKKKRQTFLKVPSRWFLSMLIVVDFYEAGLSKVWFNSDYVRKTSLATVDARHHHRTAQGQKLKKKRQTFLKVPSRWFFTMSTIVDLNSKKTLPVL